MEYKCPKKKCRMNTKKVKDEYCPNCKYVMKLKSEHTQYAAALQVFVNAKLGDSLQSVFNLINFHQDVAEKTLKTGKLP